VLSSWGCEGIEFGKFDEPHGLAINGFDHVLVVEEYNHRVQHFTREGQFIKAWGSEGSDNGQFRYPRSIATNSAGDIYVLDKGNYRVQKFNSNGEFLLKWGNSGSDEGQFSSPWGICIDTDGHVYVSDQGNDRVQKFDSSGTFITKWGTLGSGDGEFRNPRGIVTDSDDNVFVSDSLNARIQKFTSDGIYLMQWGCRGSTTGCFENLSGLGPTGITVDANDNIYVIDDGNYRIQKFSSDGTYINQYGEKGFSPGQFAEKFLGLSLFSDGALCVADTGNDRIQVIKPIALQSNSKAIIVAGGGSFPGNNLWEPTQMCANFAYRTLTYQGFSKESIYYLTSDTDLDLDNNREFDDVDGDVNNNNFQQAITTWASDADSLVVYLVDHGGNSTFRMSGTETLSASDLDSWLDTLQTSMPGKVTVIYDACESGSFISSLTPPQGKERVVITSTSLGESAYFVTQGSISFSNYFWTHIFNGVNVEDSFNLTKEAITYTTPYQNPLLDANGNGIVNESEDYALIENTYIGNGTTISGDVPVIGSISEEQTIYSTSSALLFASEVTDIDGIARVWTVIRPPDFNQGSSDNTVQNLPSADLMPVDGIPSRYEVTYDHFNIEGTYQIAIYARDRIGNTSIPQITTVSVENPLRRRAIIVAGGSQSDDLWPAIEKCATLVYETLTFQGYSDDDIYFMSPETFSAGVDGLATLSNINYAIETWAAESSKDLALYIVGNGGAGAFTISNTETLTATDLDSWLDNLQGTLPGKVTVVYDACRSGSFLPFLIPPDGKERILISSTEDNQSAYFLSEGDISFSKFFWRKVLNGATVRESFLQAKKAVSFSYKNQTPLLDDTGNGIGNEKPDGHLAINYRIGLGIILAGDDPLIGSIVPEQTADTGSSATIWVEDVTTTGTIDKVWAVIAPPNDDPDDPNSPISELPILDLTHVGSNRYEGSYSAFSKNGTYQITVYAIDLEGNISLPMGTNICYVNCGDDNVVDDNYGDNGAGSGGGGCFFDILRY